MNRSVLITGAARGIGRACALRFAKEGYAVTAGYVQASVQAEQLKREIERMSGQCLTVAADMRDRQAIHRMVQLSQSHFGTPDVLVCNAGMAQQKLFSDITEEDWDSMMSVNVGGMYRVIQEVLPDMIARGSGSIVTVSSMWGQVGGSCEVHYSASKAAVIGLTKALAKELGLSGIRVNCVAPGVISTEMNAMHDADVMRELAEETPLNRIGTPEEVADAIYLLASESMRFVTGQVLGVNGGLVI
jgi:3-oxoacyl-[acyl-carrier protein] reductase